jgi:hypothetical protein
MDSGAESKDRSRRDAAVTACVHRRNPIVRHGDLNSNFVQIPNELARDSVLSHHAYRIAIALRTHKGGFEVSAKSLADTYSWGRPRIAQAFNELEEAGWLAVQRHVNAEGHRVFDQYHVHVSRRFTPNEMAQYGRTMTLPGTADASTQITDLDSSRSARCSEADHGDVSSGITKEHYLEHHSEHQFQEHSVQANRRELGAPGAACYVCDRYGRHECREHAESYATASLSDFIPERLASELDGPGW